MHLPERENSDFALLLGARREGWIYLALSWTAIPLLATAADFVDLLREPAIGTGFGRRSLLARHPTTVERVERHTLARLVGSALMLTTAAMLALLLASPAHASDCPPAGSRFKRNNAGFETVLTSEGVAIPGHRGYCRYKDSDGKSGSYLLKSSDLPLDNVPRQKSGACPTGARAEYKIVLTEYSDPIVAGPDAAGRCLLRSQQFDEQWVHPTEFKLAGGGGTPAAVAMDLSGRWRCAANGNIPIALLTFSGNRYTMSDTDAGWRVKSGKVTGSGAIRLADGGFVPTSGPMADELGIRAGVYHAEKGRRALYLNNKPSGLSLLQCLPES